MAPTMRGQCESGSGWTDPAEPLSGTPSVAWTVMRRRLPDFQCAEIGSPSAESVCDIGQNGSAIHSGRSRLETEVERFSLVDLLHGRIVLCIQFRHIHEHVVVDQHAVLILVRRVAVLFQRLKLASFQT